MISNKQNPVEWALLMYEFEEVIEHFQALEKELHEKGSMSDEEFQIDIAHIYSHMNRIWNSRNRIGEQTDRLFDSESQFPTDIGPI